MALSAVRKGTRMGAVCALMPEGLDADPAEARRIPRESMVV
jgi:hypothetical protein